MCRSHVQSCSSAVHSYNGSWYALLLVLRGVLTGVLACIAAYGAQSTQLCTPYAILYHLIYSQRRSTAQL